MRWVWKLAAVPCVVMLFVPMWLIYYKGDLATCWRDAWEVLT